MQRRARPTSTEPIDRAMVANIAGKVIARLVAMSKTNNTAASISDRIVSVDTLQQLTGTPKQVFITSGSIVTPAARDEARHRGITITRTVEVPQNQQPTHARFEITDAANPERAEAVRQQLARRGIRVDSARIVLSDTPASEVYQQCNAHAERAVMIASVSDVQRFADELRPTVWVLDMKRLNIIAAVNVIARIT